MIPPHSLNFQDSNLYLTKEMRFLTLPMDLLSQLEWPDSITYSPSLQQQRIQATLCNFNKTQPEKAKFNPRLVELIHNLNMTQGFHCYLLIQFARKSSKHCQFVAVNN
ncbi:hypothetical protein VNO77_27789 [Canavalia gladiata]|uniref:Uncharacterized protein n=1 Tax=Canavalia gladiata TaxID=3824 RepID=A0AAN9Q7D4_CANGL